MSEMLFFSYSEQEIITLRFKLKFKNALFILNRAIIKEQRTSAEIYNIEKN